MRWMRVAFASGQSIAGIVVLLCFAATPAVAELTNPFAAHYRDELGSMVLNAHGGAAHGDGFGVAVGYVPASLVELKLSYGYEFDHSLAITTKLNVLPHAYLTPYFPIGYVVHLDPVDAFVRFDTHEVFAGFGLQCRLGEWFLGAELTTNVMVGQRVTVDGEGRWSTPGDRVDVNLGFTFGAYLF